MNETEFFVLPVPERDAARGSTRPITVARRAARAEGHDRPGVVWLGGFMSDMRSGKAQALDAWAAAAGRAMVRFDYSGHGASGGAFTDGTVGRWLEDALAVIRTATQDPQVFVGSSMGAWVTLLAARALAAAGEADRIAGIVLIAPAVDFTERLMWDRFDDAIRAEIMDRGVWHRPSAYGDTPYPITRALIEDGRRHLLLDTTVRAHAPVHILQGMRDEEVPWQHAMALVEHLAADPVSITLVKDGDHRLSRDEDIARLIAAVERIA